jgi:bacteriorhodopsin
MANDLSETDEALLWIGFAIMFSSFTIFYAMLRTTAPGKRLFHVYTCAIVGFASTAYLWMALGTYKRQRVLAIFFARVFVLYKETD